MVNWVALKDKLPDVYHRVLVYIPKHGVYIGKLWSYGWWELEKALGDKTIYVDPTHWAELPMPSNATEALDNH